MNSNNPKMSNTTKTAFSHGADIETPSVRAEGSMSRRSLLRAFCAYGVVTAAPVYANAANYIRGSGDIRQIAMRNDRTGEIIDMVYWIDGKYIGESLRQINYFFRDWRQNKSMDIDPHTVDIIAATQRMLDTSEPYLLLSGYRTVQTNRSLRGTASNSFHTKGMAADLRMRSRSTKQVANAARTVHSGGVGTYYRSGFVHMDSGPIRQWRG